MTFLLLATLEHNLQQLDHHGLRRRRRRTETPCLPQVQVDGRPMLAFASNDYLGLAAHPLIVDALREGASRYDAGSGASHLISGHSQAHAALEEKLAEVVSPYLEQARALYFCTGYMANLAVLTALVGRDDAIFSESLNHASLINGARLSHATVHVYPHGDVDALDGLHGFGVLGKQGHGVLAHFGLRSPYLIYMGTLGKAAGVGGAFVAAHALLTSLELIAGAEGDARRRHLQALIGQLRAGLQLQRWQHLPSDTAIQPIIIHANDATMHAADTLYARGLWVPAIRPPTVPSGSARLHVTLSAAHATQDVGQLVAALNLLERES
jgi:8-amino-7-oxononanoate synthase